MKCRFCQSDISPDGFLKAQKGYTDDLTARSLETAAAHFNTMAEVLAGLATKLSEHPDINSLNAKSALLVLSNSILEFLEMKKQMMRAQYDA